MAIWTLASSAEKKVRLGHPWALKQEIVSGLKATRPGSRVILKSEKGDFIAHGYGNPESSISFRVVSRDLQQSLCLDLEQIVQSTIRAWRARFEMGYQKSFRVVYGESDFLPGFVLDRYVDKEKQVLVLQVTTRGMSEALLDPEHFLKRVAETALTAGLSKISLEQTAFVLRNDVAVRKFEGLEVEEPRVLREVSGWNLTELNAEFESGLELNCDVLAGQKTGLFLDQTQNIQTVLGLLPQPAASPFRVLDLCCYVGQWSANVARVLSPVEATLVDVSKSALQRAQLNLERLGAKTILRQHSALDHLEELPRQSFDLVIADPPAFAKSKKDIPTATHAYMKLNDQAFRLAKPGGLVVSCSCSGVVTDADFRESLAKALHRSGREARCVAQGGPAPDHPVGIGFPEGRYLKVYVHKMT